MDFVSPELKGTLGRGLLLKFSDENLEASFWEQRLESRKSFLEGSLILITLVSILTAARFMPYISEKLPEQSMQLDFIVRAFLICPLLLACFAAIRLRLNYKLIQRGLLACGMVGCLAFSSLMALSNIDGTIYYNYSFIHVLLFMFVVLLIPIKSVFFGAFFLCAFHIGAVYLGNIDAVLEQVLFYTLPSVTIFLIMSYAGYAMESSERYSFLYRTSLQSEYEQRVSIEQERAKWLGLMTDILRHELKNSLLGVSSSLELVNRKNQDSQLARYIERATSSTQFMRRLLDEASTSTDLESALIKINRKELDLSQAIRDKIGEYREAHDGYSFDAIIQDKIYANLDPDRLFQALDKLINNAIEHSDAGHPITVSLSRNDNDAHLIVANIGDALSENVDIFQPLVSGKVYKIDENVGLGLFVVKRIVEAHGGTVFSRGLVNPDGAEFTISLPLESKTQTI